MTTRHGPYADTRDMRAIHAVFRREFGSMPALVRGVTAGDKERAQVVADHVAVISSLLHHHHLSEDKSLWPTLLDRNAEDVARLVSMIKEQHERIERMITEIDTAIRTWRDVPSLPSGKALADAIDRMNAPLKDHMDLEEGRILPIVEQCVTAAEWARMIQEGAANAPQESLLLVFGMTMYEAEPDVIAGLLSQMPPQARTAMKEQASKAFASHSERVYGTATPPRSNVSSHR